VHPVAAFLGVTVPPGVTDITVAFTPHVQSALTWFSNLVLFSTVVGTLLLTRRTRADSYQPVLPVHVGPAARTS
jgi:hypothetical protein